MRTEIALGLIAWLGCGDNAGECGYVEPLSSLRNIWSPQLAVDDDNVYYSDYNIDGIGTHLVLSQPRTGGAERSIGVRGPGYSFGYGMALDASYLYWTVGTGLGYALFATPRNGGPSEQRALLLPCLAHGVAVDATSVYAGTMRCDTFSSRVTAVAGDGTSTTIWESTVADVEDIAAAAGDVFVATTGGLVRVRGAEIVLLDGRPAHRMQVTTDELVYSTDEGIYAFALSGGGARRLYVFHTSIGSPRAFAIDDEGVFVSEPPQILYVPNATAEPYVVVGDAGTGVHYIAARGGSAYWATLAMPGSPGTPNSLSGAVLRVARPCVR